MFIEAHVWQTVIPKSLQVYQLGKIWVRKSRTRGHSQDTDNQPYECTTEGVLDVNKGMTGHFE